MSNQTWMAIAHSFAVTGPLWLGGDERADGA